MSNPFSVGKMTLDKAIRCLPSFLLHLKDGAKDLDDLQIKVVGFGMRHNLVAYEQNIKALTMRKPTEQGKKLLNWLEVTNGGKLQKL